MIKTKDELDSALYDEYNLYFNNSTTHIKSFFLKERKYYIWNYQKSLRYLEFYARAGIVSKIFYAYYSKKVNLLGRKLGIEMWHSCFDKGLLIYHPFGIVVNSSARIGKNCKLHGRNCIGNDGIHKGCPIIGDNCELGVGSNVIGEINLGNNVVIAAGAVVNKTFDEDNILLAGVPAKIVKRY